jgi:hypothetical protein
MLVGISDKRCINPGGNDFSFEFPEQIEAFLPRTESGFDIDMSRITQIDELAPERFRP